MILATGSQPILPPIEGAEIKEGGRTFEATLKTFNSLNFSKTAREVIDKLNDRLKISNVAVCRCWIHWCWWLKLSNVMEKKLSLSTLIWWRVITTMTTDLMAKNEAGIKLAFGETVKAVEKVKLR